MNFLKKLWSSPTVQYLAKNAVNAAVLALVQMYHDPQDNNFHDWHGIKGVLWIMGSAILAREGMIVVPKIIKWSTTNGGTMKVILALALTLSFASNLKAQQPAGIQTKPTHAFVTIMKVVAAPVVKPKRTLKDILGGALFAVETGVDVVHTGFNLADKAFDAIGVAGKIPTVDAVYAVVSVINTDSGKLDLWLERQEQYLFGTHN